MTKDDIIRMAKDADCYASRQTDDRFDWQIIRDERFAALVAAALSEQTEQEPIAVKCECLAGCQHCQGSGWILATAAPVKIEAAVLAEREACAKVADGELMNTNMLTSYPPKSSAAWNIAAAIRARGK